MLLSDFSGVYASSVSEATPLEWPQTVAALLMRDPDVACKFFGYNEETEELILQKTSRIFELWKGRCCDMNSIRFFFIVSR